MIFKMAAVRHVGFSKLDMLINYLACACDYASELEISSYSDTMEPSYSQTNDLSATLNWEISELLSRFRLW